MPMKNFSDTAGNRTRDLPACSAVPQHSTTGAGGKIGRVIDGRCNLKRSVLYVLPFCCVLQTKRTKWTRNIDVLLSLSAVRYVHSDVLRLLAFVSRPKCLTRPQCNVSCVVGFAFAVLPSALRVRIFLFTTTHQPPSGPWSSHYQGFMVTLRHTPQSVELLWTSDQLVAETSTHTTQHSQQTDIHAPGGIRTRNSS